MKHNKNENLIRFLTRSGVIAAMYAALTLVISPLAFGNWQLRISEALTVLPLYFPEAIPGLFVGCLLSNLITMNVFDIVFGSLATLLAAYLTYLCRNLGRAKKYTAVLPPIFVNAIVVGAVLSFTTAHGDSFWVAFALNFFSIFIGEALSCGILGLGLCFVLERLFKRNKK